MVRGRRHCPEPAGRRPRRGRPLRRGPSLRGRRRRADARRRNLRRLVGPGPAHCHRRWPAATVLVNLSASNEVVGKAAYRRQLVVNQSGRCMAAYVYASCGVWESTTDVVFGGHCLIAENGVLLAESHRFRRDDVLLAADVDIDRLRADRGRINSFGDTQLYVAPTAAASASCSPCRRPPPTDLRRTIDAASVRPQGRRPAPPERCEEIFQTQVAGLAKRLEHIGKPATAIGVSGGLDSTLALLVACKTMDALAVPALRILRLDAARLRHQQPHARQRPRPDAPSRRRGPRGGHSALVPGGDAGPRATSRSASHWTDSASRNSRSCCAGCRTTAEKI